MSDKRLVYLDYAATTPVDPEVLETMLPYFTEVFGNANSLYEIGRDAYRALEAARESFARNIGAENPNEVIFTSGGTESDTTALLGILRRNAPDGGHIIVSAFEHHAILEPAEWLEKHGYEVSIVQPRNDGYIYPEDVAALIRDDTKLVSVMHANNEIGTVQPIRAIADVAHAGGAYMHTDAAQSLGKIPFDVKDLGVDAASFSSHKFYGPKGVGALYLKRGTAIDPILRGGGQESKKRSGTQNVAGVVGMAKALEIMLARQAEEEPRMRAQKDRIIEGVTSGLINTVATVPVGGGPTLPNIASLLVKGAEGEALLLQLDNKGIQISTGSACSSGSLEPSHVLLACGVPQEVAHGSLRVTVGRYTTDDDVDYFLAELPPIVDRLRSMNPLYERLYGKQTR